MGYLLRRRELARDKQESVTNDLNALGRAQGASDELAHLMSLAERAEKVLKGDGTRS